MGRMTVVRYSVFNRPHCSHCNMLYISVIADTDSVRYHTLYILHYYIIILYDMTSQNDE